MRWEDERYVRLYTRNTPEWSSLSWRARGLFGLIMREVDRAGILELGKLGAKGVAVAVRAPWVEVEGPLSELLDDGCVRVDQVRQCLFMPNFMEAQECAQSDVARKRASREKARAVFGVTSGSAAELAMSVKNRDHMTSQNVTESHVESHAVTNGHVRSLLTKPTLPEPNQDTEIHVAEDRDGEASEGKSGAKVRAVFAAWVDARREHHRIGPTPKLDGKRRKVIIDRLREGHDVSTLKRAAAGIWQSAWHRGANDRSREFADITLALRDAEHVEQFAAVADSQTDLRARPRQVVELFGESARPPEPEPTPEERAETSAALAKAAAAFDASITARAAK